MSLLKRRGTYRWGLFVLLGVATLATFTWNVQHHALLTDDAFISFRYAKNLIAGHGLVWNPGERVEGYTNFLWVLAIAAGMKAGIAPQTFAHAAGILSGLGILVALAVFTARRAGWSHPLVVAVPLVLATSRSFTGWCTGGLATQFFSLLVFLAFLTHLRERKAHSTYPWGSSLLFAVAALTRPEGLLFTALAGIGHAAEVLRGRRSLRSLVAWAMPFIMIVGTHVLWRHAYYGFWLPNTFYAKVPGTYFSQGLRYLAVFHEDYHIGWFLPLLLILLLVRPRYTDALAFAFLAGFCAYLLYIGGDLFEFRFLVMVFPYGYSLLAASLHVLGGLWGADGRRRCGGVSLATAIYVALLLCTHLGSVRPEATHFRDGVQSLEGLRTYTESRIWQGRYLRAHIESGDLPHDVVFATGGAGAVPYFTEWYTVDILGLNDVEIARMPITKRGLVGHERRVTPEYLEGRGVEMLDLRRQIIRERPGTLGPRQQKKYGDRWRSVKLGAYYLSFATFLTDEEFAERFPRLR